MEKNKTGNGTVLKVEKTDNYTVMSNQHFRVKNMSLKAKGLLSLLLSLPNNWEYSISGLQAICRESYNSIKNILDELKQLGYLEVKKIMPNESKSGRIEYQYVIYENSKMPKKLDFGKSNGFFKNKS